MMTMYVLRKILGRFEVKYFVRQQFGLLNMWKMKMGQQKIIIHSTLIAPLLFLRAISRNEIGIKSL